MRTSVTFRIDDELMARVRQRAAETKTTITDFVSQALAASVSGPAPAINMGDERTIHVEFDTPASQISAAIAQHGNVTVDPVPPTPSILASPMIPSGPVSPPTPDYLQAKTYLKEAIRSNPKPAGHHPSCRCRDCRA